MNINYDHTYNRHGMQHSDINYADQDKTEAERLTRRRIADSTTPEAPGPDYARNDSPQHQESHSTAFNDIIDSIVRLQCGPPNKHINEHRRTRENAHTQSRKTYRNKKHTTYYALRNLTQSHKLKQKEKQIILQLNIKQQPKRNTATPIHKHRKYNDKKHVKYYQLRNINRQTELSTRENKTPETKTTNTTTKQNTKEYLSMSRPPPC